MVPSRYIPGSIKKEGLKTQFTSQSPTLGFGVTPLPSLSGCPQAITNMFSHVISVKSPERQKTKFLLNSLTNGLQMSKR